MERRHNQLARWVKAFSAPVHFTQYGLQNLLFLTRPPLVLLFFPMITATGAMSRPVPFAQRLAGATLSLFCLFHSAAADLTLLRQSPAPGATNVCLDTLLQLEFSQPPLPATNGLIRILRTESGLVADVIDLSEPLHTNLFGTKILRYEPVRLEGARATIQLHARALEPNTRYTVSIDSAVFGCHFNLPWHFTTRAALPKGLTRLEVAPESRGEFCTLQGAVDYIPEDNFTPFEIQLRNGTYDAVAYLGPGRNRIHLIGEDRHQTILAGRNNDRLNPGRMMRPFFSIDADDITIENLTIHNTTPYKGSQAEALRLEGERCLIRNCNFLSYQDTLLLNGRIYVADCYIEGDVDFIWGHGVTFFDRCELKAMHDGYYLTSRNPPDRFGFVFNHCRLTAVPEVKRCWLARIETGRFPASAIAFLNCRMGPHIPPAGWLVTGDDSSRLRFFEFSTAQLDGSPADISQRHPASRQLTAAEARELADPNQVLAARDTWKPIKN
jgi:pectin methylesterase-like acyl-CoA thioesterase